MIDTHVKAFIEEASELISELENSLIEIERNPGKTGLIDKIFRALHTVKGSAGMFGYDDISMFTHDIETAYDLIRNGSLSITKDIIDLTLEACDQITLMLRYEDKSKIDESKTKSIVQTFGQIVLNYKKSMSASEELLQEEKPVLQSSEETKTFLIQFVPDSGIFLTGTNPINLIKEIKTLGQTVLIGYFGNVPELDFVDPEKCYTGWDILLRTSKGADAVQDVFIFVEDYCDLSIEVIDSGNKLPKEEDFFDFGNLLLDICKTKKPEIKELLLDFQTSSVPSGGLEDKTSSKSKDVADNHHDGEAVSSLRVSAEKLDELVNLVGELVTIQARLSEIASINNDPTMLSVAEEVERITWSLRDSALNIRMLPIGTTFSKFKRLVRDLSKELGKQVELTTDGGETELDKTVIDRLADPLVHIIRNSIDHGIENPDMREQKGKSRMGKVHLAAAHSAGNVLIIISDDGAGLNKEAIREKAVARGLISAEQVLTDSEIYNLTFLPGFSTAKQVTNVSGRGVGMDAVKLAIEALRGSVQIESTEGKGTRITLKLPLTLAIIDGLLVSIEQENFILPLSAVEECIELINSQVKIAHHRHVVHLRGEMVPYIRLRENLQIAGKTPDIEQIVVMNINGSRIGFVVDTVVGQHQTVIKSLGKIYKNAENISGATILGNGTVALILDVIKIAQNEETIEKLKLN